jgi:MFS transporter, DHA3 family, macrolide efflux protein
MRTVFKIRDFRTLWIAQFVSIFGDFLALFGVISLMTFRLHGTVTQVTYVTVSYGLCAGARTNAHAAGRLRYAWLVA